MQLPLQCCNIHSALQLFQWFGRGLPAVTVMSLALATTAIVQEEVMLTRLLSELTAQSTQVPVAGARPRTIPAADIDCVVQSLTCNAAAAGALVPVTTSTPSAVSLLVLALRYIVAAAGIEGPGEVYACSITMAGHSVIAFHDVTDRYVAILFA